MNLSSSVMYRYIYHVDLTIDEYRFLFIGATFTIATALLRLAIEVIQLCSHPLEYLQDWVNWLEIPLYLCSIIFTFVFATPCLCVYNWQWQIGAIAVFLSWIGLVSFLQKWPVTGVYILMFINIIQSFLKIAFLALLLVIAFALPFYMLFFETDEMVSILHTPEQLDCGFHLSLRSKPINVNEGCHITFLSILLSSIHNPDWIVYNGWRYTVKYGVLHYTLRHLLCHPSY